MTSTNLLYIYVIIINVVTFFIYGLDKSRAKAGQWRIPEAQLIFLAVIGGSVAVSYTHLDQQHDILGFISGRGNN